jgi:hypothetical protein
MEFVIIGAAFVVGAILGIALVKLQAKASDGKIEASEIICAITEAEATFNEFCATIKAVIKDPAINNDDTVKLIEEAVDIVQAVRGRK